MKPESDSNLLILGAGAAGMMAAISAAETNPNANLHITLLEKNIRPGIKVLVCGGGRCNFTNAGTVDFLIEQFGRNGRFLTPALRGLDNDALRDFFATLGVPSHIEPGGKVYPNSNQAKSVVDALVRRMRELGVHTQSGPQHAAASVEKTDTGFLTRTVGGEAIPSQKLILAVGGMSYQRMGTVGDGYRLAQSLGHSIITPRPAIVGLITAEAAQENSWVKPLQGLAMRDIEVRIERGGGGGGGGGRTSKGGRGEGRTSIGDMLFTHFGISGPAILNPSEIVAEMLEAQPTVTLRIDFARHTTHEEAHAILRQWQREHGRKRVRTMLAQGAPKEILITSTSPDTTAIETPDEKPAAKPKLSFPVRFAEALCAITGISDAHICAELTSKQMHALVEQVKRCTFTITATRGFKEAMVTAGGVKLSEVDPNTLHSKITPNLFLTGEVLDLTGPSGGYNLQLAFSTGRLAGIHAAQS